MGNGDYTFGIVYLVFFATVIYLFPTIVAIFRGKRVWPVALVNIFMGWTIGGWFVAFFMAAWN